MMTEREIMDLFARAGALLSGHFVLSSGKHSENYINKNAIYTGYEIHPLCEELVCRLATQSSALSETEAVLGPATGGIVLSRLVSDYITKRTGKRPLSVYADILPNGNYVIRRGYDKLIAGKKVLIVDDIMTTGESVRKVAEAARLCGAKVLGAAVLWNRGGKILAKNSGVPHLFALVEHKFDSWSEDDCPLCKQGIEVNREVGHGMEFYMRKFVKAIETGEVFGGLGGGNFVKRNKEKK